VCGRIRQSAGATAADGVCAGLRKDGAEEISNTANAATQRRSAESRGRAAHRGGVEIRARKIAIKRAVKSGRQTTPINPVTTPESGDVPTELRGAAARGGDGSPRRGDLAGVRCWRRFDGRRC